MAATALALCLTANVAAPAAGAAIRPSQIDAFLLEQGSPLAGEGRTFCDAGRRYGVDPAFLVAVCGAETGFGRYLYCAGPRTATYNAFNWFFAPTRVDSDFSGWGQAIDTVAAGLQGPLYYGAGRYSAFDIAPVYCPQGTANWIANVTNYMTALGADPFDTRWRDSSPGAGEPLRNAVGPTGTRVGPSLIVRRPICHNPAVVVAGARLRIRFTLTNVGLEAGRWRAVILRLEGPSGRSLAFGCNAGVRLAAGASYRFVATARLQTSGLWRGWIDVEAQNGTILAAARPEVRLEVRRASATRRGATVASRGRRAAT